MKTGISGHDADVRWTELIKEAWDAADHGEIEKALEKYREADSLNMYVPMNPELSILRHTRGEAKGRVIPLPQNEQQVLALAITILDSEAPDARGLTKPVIHEDVLEENIRAFMDHVHIDFGIQSENIKKDLPHVLIASTGRCGTVSLYRLFEQSNLMAFHSYLWNASGTVQTEMACRFLAGNFETSAIAIRIWLECRAAEWLGAINEDRPMVGCCHLDTVFAPVFAKLHPLSKIVFLRRNPIDVFKSFYNKEQWNKHQIYPSFYAFDPYFKWRSVAYDKVPLHAWYIYFIETFCEALVKVLGDRAIEISSEKLFAQDEEEIKRLLDFTGCDLPLQTAVDHFRTKYNAKSDKVTLTQDGIDIVTEVFKNNYEIIQHLGTL